MTTAESIAREAAWQRRLWHSPFDAPDMPPREVFREWLKTPPPGRPAWLTAQLTSHPLGPDALSLLQLEPLLPPDPPQPPITEELSTMMQAAWAARPRTSAPQPASPPPIHLARGVLCHTMEKLECFDPDRPVMQERRTWQPQDILLTAGPWQEEGDTLWRALAVTPAALWPEGFREPDDLPVHDASGGEWIAHLWLEYPVSEAQIAGTLSILDGASLALLEEANTALPEGLPLEDPATEEVRDRFSQLERDRLMARASFLSATADARRALAEWREALAMLIGGRISPELRAVYTRANELALAGGDEHPDALCMVFEHADLGLPLENPKYTFRAPAGSAANSWNLAADAEAPAIPNRTSFGVVDADNCCVAIGEVKGGIARIGKVLDAARLAACQGRAWLLLFI